MAEKFGLPGSAVGLPMYKPRGLPGGMSYGPPSTDPGISEVRGADTVATFPGMGDGGTDQQMRSNEVRLNLSKAMLQEQMAAQAWNEKAFDLIREEFKRRSPTGNYTSMDFPEMDKMFQEAKSRNPHDRQYQKLKMLYEGMQ